MHYSHKYLLASNALSTLDARQHMHCSFCVNFNFQNWNYIFFVLNCMEIAMFRIASLNFGLLTTSRGGMALAPNRLANDVTVSNNGAAKLIPSSDADEKIW